MIATQTPGVSFALCVARESASRAAVLAAVKTATVISTVQLRLHSVLLKGLTPMPPPNPKQQALDAITAVLEALKDDANALVRTKSGEVNPGAAKIELISALASLADQ